MRRQVVAEPHDIEGHDLMSCAEQLWNEHAAFVAAASGNENLHATGSHEAAGVVSTDSREISLPWSSVMIVLQLPRINAAS